MQQDPSILDQIASQREAMVDRVRRWSAICSGSSHRAGLEQMIAEVKSFWPEVGHQLLPLAPRRWLDDEGVWRENLVAPALLLSCRSEAPIQILLCGHIDTVYGAGDPFQASDWMDELRLRGPGVADMKGGLVVALTALKAFEGSQNCERVGWRFFFTPDEEVGSPSSTPELLKAAEGCKLALLFEPALPDGALVSQRKGSVNLILIARGKSAHVGRNPEEGVSAISMMINSLSAIETIKSPLITLNIGSIRGGGAVNRVAHLCTAQINIRSDSIEEIDRTLDQIATIVQGDGVEFHILSYRPPKGFDKESEQLFREIAQCGQEIGLKLAWRATGGACDGNQLATEGIPVCDTLGVRGGSLHSDQEFLWVDSLVERAQLTALFLMKLANGESRWSR